MITDLYPYSLFHSLCWTISRGQGSDILFNRSVNIVLTWIGVLLLRSSKPMWSDASTTNSSHPLSIGRCQWAYRTTLKQVSHHALTIHISTARLVGLVCVPLFTNLFACSWSRIGGFRDLISTEVGSVTIRDRRSKSEDLPVWFWAYCCNCPVALLQQALSDLFRHFLTSEGTFDLTNNPSTTCDKLENSKTMFCISVSSVIGSQIECKFIICGGNYIRVVYDCQKWRWRKKQKTLYA